MQLPLSQCEVFMSSNFVARRTVRDPTALGRESIILTEHRFSFFHYIGHKCSFFYFDTTIPTESTRRRRGRCFIFNLFASTNKLRKTRTVGGDDGYDDDRRRLQNRDRLFFSISWSDALISSLLLFRVRRY